MVGTIGRLIFLMVAIVAATPLYAEEFTEASVKALSEAEYQEKIRALNKERLEVWNAMEQMGPELAKASKATRENISLKERYAAMETLQKGNILAQKQSQNYANRIRLPIFRNSTPDKRELLENLDKGQASMRELIALTERRLASLKAKIAKEETP